MDEFDLVVLQDNTANERLRAGDVGTILTVYNEGKAFEVEFVTLTGESVAVETLLPHQIRMVRSSEVMAVRDMILKEETNS
ncbi:DUF4926 domain-containing protein [Spirosoma utsteinense]|uniref:DUF4926 domain-containing protein n=1 Tax=Spirosoma utsteinense TaxID=2585773 RepID=A0ABR6W5S5_9BACT|nr:DUF4926 domain-containing protein [Spirosoma utsteinense]MBC3784808.1 hypothetical protein [Spirosoma utsteinense]MBC3791155.1 hypothetical protein [Spirosoma utsteinense]